MDAYKMTHEELFAHFHTEEKGLSEKEARRRLTEYGPNLIEESVGRGLLGIFLSQFTSPLIFILIIAGVLTFLFKEFKDTIVITIAVMSNATIGFFQEFNAERSVKSLKNLLVAHAVVRRDFEEVEIHADRLVPGDIVILTSGLKIPADIRLIESQTLTVDESSLTGESLAVEKSTHVLNRDGLTPGDQKNMAFMGTTIIKGQGLGIVVQTGKNTVLGSIAEKVSTVDIAKTPLQIKMNRFAQFVSFVVLIGIVLIFSVGLFKGLSTHELFFQVIAVAVAAIPEGLPIVVTIAMAIGIQRMARSNTIIRTLPSVETLGSTTVICSDKTGTLTQNQMTVEKLYDGKHIYDVDGTGYEMTGSILKEGVPVKQPHDGLLTILKIGALCNESILVHHGDKVTFNGDPTEAALIISAAKAGIHQDKLAEELKRLDSLPFESGRNYMATLHEVSGKRIIFVKGSPERIAELSSQGENTSIEEYLKVSEELARQGLRVLGMAFKQVPASIDDITEDDIKGLTFCGLQGMMDPPRNEAIQAIKGCQRAGIRVIMITGDHSVTARAIGTKLGICHHESPFITGVELESMSDADLYARVEEVSVFARVAPEHKLRIVQQLMKRGEIVAVTGDGVNDAPALKAAHIGIAMGKSGTDVAKEAANMIIRDDNFASIFKAVYEGRVVFDNIRKAVAFLIPTGFAAIITIFVTIIAGVPAPYLAAQLLWINLVASGIQDIALAFEPGDRHILRQAPRNPQEGIMSRSLLRRAILVSIVISVGVLFVFFNALNRGLDLRVAQTMAVTTMVFFQFFQVWNSRSEKESIFVMNPFSNMVLFYGLIGALFAHILVLYHPMLEWLFSLKPLDLAQWLEILAVASTVIVVIEVDKWYVRRKDVSTSL
ncbi:HAD-IC family P-type ATPase [Candidatus Woesebacteria bacterium]|nr:HAD-IC family P-type ATPase [Candidatus Woesebacteria bacterium]